MSGPEAFDGNSAFDGDSGSEGIDGFDDVVDLLRDGPLELTDEQPRPAVWAGIADELGLTAAAFEPTVVSPDVSSEEYVGDNEHAVDADAATNVISLADRRPLWGRPAAIVTLAAAVVLLLAVPVALSLRSTSSSELVASAELELLDGQSGVTVSAELVSDDGDLVLEVDSPVSVGDGEFLELWLLEIDDSGVQSLESLGRVDGSGRYDVPDDIDLERFDVVDISLEIDDGNPDHSGISVVRGDLV